MKVTAKVAAVATGLAMATSMLSFAPMVHAAAACNVGTANLTVGASGASVTNLQKALIGAGFSIPAGATGYFGAQTKTAVAAWQASVKISPAAGFFGPLSRAAFNLSCGETTGTGTGTSGVAGCQPGDLFSRTTGQSCSATTGTGAGVALTGTEGTIDDVTQLSQYSGEKVGEGEKSITVLGAEVKASKDGDIALKSVRVEFDNTGNTGSLRLNRYIKSASVYLGSTKVGSADVADFNLSGNVYSKVISLSGDTAIKAGEASKLYVKVDGATTIDSADISGDSWTVDLVNIRYVDGSGVYTTEDTTGDLGALAVGIDFVSYASAAETKLKITTASDSPAKSMVKVDDNNTTDNVVLLKGSLKLEGSSDITLNELPVTFTTSAANLSHVTGSVTLKIGDQEFTKNMTATGAATTITFDNLDYNVGAGDTVSFQVLADLNSVDTNGVTEGDFLKAEVTSTNRDYIDAENEQGDQLDDSSEKSGTALGEYQELRSKGVYLKMISSSVAATTGQSANDDLGTFTIKYSVTAFGDTAYVSSLADFALIASGVTTGKTTVFVDRAGTATVGGISVTLTNSTDTTLNAAGLYQIQDGETNNFELTTTVQLPTAGYAGQFRAALGGVSWSNSDTDATPDNKYTSNLDSFKTVYYGLN